LAVIGFDRQPDRVLSRKGNTLRTPEHTSVGEIKEILASLSHQQQKHSATQSLSFVVVNKTESLTANNTLVFFAVPHPPTLRSFRGSRISVPEIRVPCDSFVDWLWLFYGLVGTGKDASRILGVDGRTGM
jgi:hypothetical protein